MLHRNRIPPCYIYQATPHFFDSFSTSNPASIHNILLCTILNPIYNITVDVIHAIMSPYGNVLRIVVFNKNGVQALVEFQDANSAVQAYTALDGKDVSQLYSFNSRLWFSLVVIDLRW